MGVTEEGEASEDVVAGVNGKEAVTVTYLEAAEAKVAFAVGVLDGVVAFEEDFVDMLAAGLTKEEMGEDLVEEEEPPLKALKQEEDASALHELMYQEMEWLMAMQLQPLEWFPHFASIQPQMDLVLLGCQVLENYQACDHLVQGFAHHNLV